MMSFPKRATALVQATGYTRPPAARADPDQPEPPARSIPQGARRLTASAFGLPGSADGGADGGEGVIASGIVAQPCAAEHGHPDSIALMDLSVCGVGCCRAVPRAAPAPAPEGGRANPAVFRKIWHEMPFHWRWRDRLGQVWGRSWVWHSARQRRVILQPPCPRRTKGRPQVLVRDGTQFHAPGGTRI